MHSNRTREQQPGIRVIGYTAAPPSEILSVALAGGDWTAFPGDYVAVAESKGEVHILTSAIAASPYFYSIEGGQFDHCQNVFDLSTRLPGGWQWAPRALRALALFGHTFAEDTLHAQIRRVPAATHLHWNGVVLHTRTRPPFEAQRPGSSDATPEDALHVCLDSLVAAFRDLPRGPLTISLSAGLDSRLLLALALRERPPSRAVCMGRADSTDLRVASELAKRAGVPLTPVELMPHDYSAISGAASRQTGGSKTARNWHTAIYPRKGGLTSLDVHLVGSNGELARSFFLPQSRLPLRALSAIANMPEKAIVPYWLARMGRRFARFRKEWEFLGASAMTRLAGDLRSALEPLPPARNLGEKLDLFYSLVRCRHFIGNGLALYGMHGTPCSPFLDYRWAKSAYALPRRQKVFDYFHRWALGQLRPSDLDLPFNGMKYASLESRPHRVEEVHGYSVFRDATSVASVRDRLLDDRSLDQFLPRPAREQVLRAGALDDIDLLWTLSAAADQARGESTPGRLHVADSGKG